MDFGDVSISSTSLAPNEITNQEKYYGSGIFLEQDFFSNSENDLRGSLKVAKTIAFDDFSASKAMQKSSSLLRSNSNNNFDTHGSQMLCFSSPNLSQSDTFPFYHSSSNAYTRNAAFGSGFLNCGSMQSSKGTFTPSQWMELEHQALIYKYIHANVPIPYSLLIPIRKAIYSAGFSGFMGLRSTTYGWGAYQLRHSNSTDLEPGRCRRTDGKKWRCSRDAMSDHKYCERHMNRGRHRSRKPVEEGQSGHSVAGTTNTNSTKQKPPMVVSSSIAAAVVAGGSTAFDFDNLGLRTCQSLSNTPSAMANLGVKYQDITGLSMISSPSVNFTKNQYSNSKPQEANQEPSGGKFGQVCYDSLLNPFNKSSSFVDCSSYGGASEEFKDLKNVKPQNGLHQFFTEWHNSQLSISVPSSPNTNENAVSFPSNHSRNLESTTQMDFNNKESSWIPVNWESSSSMGGPLAEVLHNNTNNITSVDNKAPSLNLMTGGGWGDCSPYMASSPTGVLQKASFLSSSNSSAVSSPRSDINKAYKCGCFKNLVLPDDL